MVFTRLFLGFFDCAFALFTIALFMIVPHALANAALFVSSVVLIKGLLSFVWSASTEKFYPEQQMIVMPAFDIALGMLLMSSGIYWANFLGIIAIIKGLELLISDIQGKLIIGE